MDILSFAKEQYLSLQNRKEWIKGELKKAPAGRISIQKRGDYYRWYLYKDQKRQYLPKRNRQEAEDLAYKLYLETELEDINLKLFALESFLKLYGSRSGRAETLLEENPAIRELISPRLLAMPDDLERWANEKYEKSTKHPEHLKFPTVRGELVRSKSEALISYVLVQNHIPYRYECALPINGRRSIRILQFYGLSTGRSSFGNIWVYWTKFRTSTERHPGLTNTSKMAGFPGRT